MNYFTAKEVRYIYSDSGIDKCRKTIGQLFVLSLFAGLIIGAAGATASMTSHSVDNVGIQRLVTALMFAFGIGTIIVFNAELFTGNMLLTISLADKKITLHEMLRNWIVVISGNFIGAAITATACVYFGVYHYSHEALAVYALNNAIAKCSLTFSKALLSGIACNILVCMGILLANCSKDVFGRYLASYVAVMFFVAIGFEHSIANVYYIVAGLLIKFSPTYLEAVSSIDVSMITVSNAIFSNLIPVLIGNMIGGITMAQLFRYAWTDKE